MAATPPRQRPTLLHRQHEPLRRYLHSKRPAVGAARGRGHYGCAGGGQVSSDVGLGGCGDGEWEVVFVDVGFVDGGCTTNRAGIDAVVVVVVVVQ